MKKFRNYNAKYKVQRIISEKGGIKKKFGELHSLAMTQLVARNKG